MARHEPPVPVHDAKQPAAARPDRPVQAPTQARRCPGAAAQLAAVHRTLRRGTVLQLQAGAPAAARQAGAPNRTGLPDKLKSGVEALSGVALDDVRVHYNSPKPAQLNALAYTQDSDIHVAPGQEQHLPHEAWHVVQQAQGRVKPTLQMKEGVPVNDERHLEDEADVMGARALAGVAQRQAPQSGLSLHGKEAPVQRAIGYEAEVGALDVVPMPDHDDPHLHKGMVLWRLSGWEVTVDELDQRFDVEFRTDPIDDLAAGGRSTAQSRLQAIAALWNRIAGNAGLQPANSLNSSAPANVGIQRIGPQFAQLQATAGLSLDALRAIRTGTALQDFAPGRSQDVVLALGESGGAADAAVAVVLGPLQGQIRAALGLGPLEDIGNLSAVIGMIVNIPFTARHGGITYAKQAAGPLLARTDFATILAQLPANQVQAIRNNAGQWRDLLIDITDRLINIDLAGGQQPAVVNAGTPAFELGSFEGADALANLTLGGWFEGLAQGEDRMTALDYAARYGDQAAANRLESLGGRGQHMDASSYSLNHAAVVEITGGLAATIAGFAAGISTRFGAAATVGGGLVAAHGLRNIGTANRDRPIFEFRALGLADAELLVQSGLALWDYVDVAHGRGPGGGNQLSASARLWNWLAS